MIKLFEKYSNLKEVKDMLILRAVNTEKLKLVKFFVEKGYDINADEVLEASSYNEDIFKYLLKKGADVENNISNNRLRETKVQKILIDFGHELFVYDRVKFNNELRNDPKYKEIIDMVEDTKKYNL